jgi:hypothetical protein
MHFCTCAQRQFSWRVQGQWGRDVDGPALLEQESKQDEFPPEVFVQPWYEVVGFVHCVPSFPDVVYGRPLGWPVDGPIETSIIGTRDTE